MAQKVLLDLHSGCTEKLYFDKTSFRQFYRDPNNHWGLLELTGRLFVFVLSVCPQSRIYLSSGPLSVIRSAIRAAFAEAAFELPWREN